MRLNKNVFFYICQIGINRKLMMLRVNGDVCFVMGMGMVQLFQRGSWWYLFKLGIFSLYLVVFFRRVVFILVYQGICKRMFIVVLVVIVGIWREFECLLQIEWIRKMWQMYIIGYFVVVRSNEIDVYVVWMDLKKKLLLKMVRNRMVIQNNIFM